MRVHEQGKIHAPEFPAGLTWLQGNALTLRELRGKVVLVSFWSYACVNCVRTLPHLVRWHKMYAEKGLEIIGVHTPEFAFEHKQEYVQNALKRYGITYPVVLDNAYVLWRAYANRCWPHVYIVSAQGVIVYDHAGEGSYATTELALQEALMERGVKDLPAIGPDVPVGGRVCYPTTPERYLGYLRGDVVNAPHAVPGEEIACTDNNEQGGLVLHGHWTMHDECVEHSRVVAGYQEYVRIPYAAFSLDVVLGHAQDKQVAVEVRLQGGPIPPDMRGEDVYEEHGKTFVWIDGPRMYTIVRSNVHHEGEVRVYVADAGVRMYTVTFGGCP